MKKPLLHVWKRKQQEKDRKDNHDKANLGHEVTGIAEAKQHDLQRIKPARGVHSGFRFWLTTAQGDAALRRGRAGQPAPVDTLVRLPSADLAEEEDFGEQPGILIKAGIIHFRQSGTRQCCRQITQPQSAPALA